MRAIPRESDRLWALLFGVTLVTMPAVALVLAYGVLSIVQSPILDRVTVVELVELYLVELAAFAAFSYILYRLALYAWARHDALADGAETADADETAVTSATDTEVDG